MKFASPLIEGVLIKRYKRFLADVDLENDLVITAHCPNTGSMRGCSEPGSRVALSLSAKSSRKYPYTLEMVKDGDTWVGVNTSRTNALVMEAILEGRVAEFVGAKSIKREVKTSAHSRLDLQISMADKSIYVEIKNCSLVRDGLAMFPDAVTTRGTRHLDELIRLVRDGHYACIFFLVQRMDADRFAPAIDIDPLYSRTLVKAEKVGVMIMVYQAQVTPKGISVVRSLPCKLTG